MLSFISVNWETYYSHSYTLLARTLWFRLHEEHITWLDKIMLSEVPRYVVQLRIMQNYQIGFKHWWSQLEVLRLNEVLESFHGSVYLGSSSRTFFISTTCCRLCTHSIVLICTRPHLIRATPRQFKNVGMPGKTVDVTTMLGHCCELTRGRLMKVPTLSRYDENEVVC